MTTEVEALVDANHAAWEGRHAARGWGKYPNEAMIRAVMGAFKSRSDRSDIRILEIGCGGGANLWFMGREGFSVAGLDISETAIHDAGVLIAAFGIPRERVDLKTGDFRRLPWPDASFDMVVDVEGLVHMPVAGIRTAVGEIARVLKPGGIHFSVIFGDRMTGANTGEMLEPGTTKNPQTGAIAGIGIVHFVTREEIPTLFAPLEIVNVDSNDRTMGGGEIHVFEWLVTARR